MQETDLLKYKVTFPNISRSMICLQHTLEITSGQAQMILLVLFLAYRVIDLKPTDTHSLICAAMKALVFHSIVTIPSSPIASSIHVVNKDYSDIKKNPSPSVHPH